MKYDKQGRELPDDTPVEIPLRFKHQAGNMDVLQQMMVRLREEQEKEELETVGEFNGDEPLELFDLPTKYELDHDVEEEALLFAENAERIRKRRRAAKKENHEDRSDRAGEENRSGGAGRLHERSGKAGGKAKRSADREGSVAADADRSADGASED